MVKIKQCLSVKAVPCIKYNYSLDPNVQDFYSQEALIKVFLDGEELEIHSMKIHENVEYVLESYPTQVERLIYDATNNP